MSLSCCLQVTDFSNFYLEKQTKKNKRLSLDHRDYRHSLNMYFQYMTLFLFVIYLFSFFLGGGGIKITLLSNSISVHKTDKNKSIKPKSNCSKRNHKQIKHSKYTISCYIMPSLYIILSLKWPLWSNNFSRQNPS